ncbi:MAG: ABC transporter ATP-binding protein [Ignavibacteria bacterium]|nr:ABC transporter ATP-binding protein [Ignavibacteria bacterium]
MSSPAIEVTNLTRKFGDFTAVNNISFTVARGDVFGFLGANGAGKSTTIRMLCGLLPATSGSALVGGFDVTLRPDDVKARIGYMSQRFSLYDDMTVAQNIRFFGGVYGLTREALDERMAWVMTMAGLSGRGDTMTRTLAGGFKQRLALGCAVLHQPEIVFLDEPTGGVDPISRRSFWELIGELSAGGTTILVTTHFLDEAEYCNDIILIEAGQLIAGGSPGRLKEEQIRFPILEVSPQDPLAMMEEIRKSDWAVETSVFGTTLHVMVTDEEKGRKEIDSLSRRLGSGAPGVHRIIPSLEDVFLHLLEQKRSGRKGAV